MTNGVEMPNRNVDYLDTTLLDKMGLLRVLPAKTLRAIAYPDLQLWGNKRGVYVFPTVELIDWLRAKIGGRTAIEIGAGHGAIGRALDIPRTDSYVQLSAEMKVYYTIHGQKPTEPPPDVLKFEASAAVANYKPQVVLGGFITQLYQPGDENEPKIGSSVFGVDELAIYEQVETYIVVGNMGPHKDKRLFAKPHEKMYFDWIVTRSLNMENDRIFVWDRTRQNA